MKISERRCTLSLKLSGPYNIFIVMVLIKIILLERITFSVDISWSELRFCSHTIVRKWKIMRKYEFKRP